MKNKEAHGAVTNDLLKKKWAGSGLQVSNFAPSIWRK